MPLTSTFNLLMHQKSDLLSPRGRVESFEGIAGSFIVFTEAKHKRPSWGTSYHQEVHGEQKSTLRLGGLLLLQRICRCWE